MGTFAQIHIADYFKLMQYTELPWKEVQVSFNSPHRSIRRLNRKNMLTEKKIYIQKYRHYKFYSHTWE